MSEIFLPLARIQERATRARNESDAAFFLELMYWGEFIVKCVTLELLAGMDHDRGKSRYALEYRLVRADGIGEWVDVLDEAAQGPSSQHLLDSARVTQRAVTQAFGVGDSAWQRRVVDDLLTVVALLDPTDVNRDSKLSLRAWFRQFAWIRNRVRGHGAPTPGRLAELCEPLEQSLITLSSNCPTFERQWAFLKRSLSGKYRVSGISSSRDAFAKYASEATHSIPDGVYVFLDEPRRVDLLFSDPDLSDFKLPNGGYKNGGRFEALSYITDERETIDGSNWLLPVEAHADSETKSLGELEARSRTLTNAPRVPGHYISRRNLEADLLRVITDDRHPVITLQGRGGVGKTSLALVAIENLCETENFFAIVWFSARDIDLLPEGPKVVKAEVLSLGDIATDYASLVGAADAVKSRAERLDHFLTALATLSLGAPVLFVFDNFETIREQADLYAAISNAVRLPNKALITTRTRDFKADYPIEVHGLEKAEFDELVNVESVRLGVGDIMTSGYSDELFEKSDGHPYIAKVLLGEVARAGKHIDLRRVVASKDRILDALFERTYGSLSPAAQRVFLTLCGWRSVVPKIGIEAALLRASKEALDVDKAVQELTQSSLVEEILDDQAHSYLSVPLAAALFGKQKLVVSPMKTAIDADLEVVRTFGAMTTAEAARGLSPRVTRMAKAVVSHAGDPSMINQGLQVLEYIADEFPPTWLTISEIHEELGDLPAATHAVERFLQREPGSGPGWETLVRLSRASGAVLTELHARLQFAETQEATVDQISNSAARLVALLQKKEIELDSDERRIMVSRLRTILESRASEANAVDISRLAWLCLHLQDVEAARTWVEKGLMKDSLNPHLLKLADRLNAEKA